MVIRLSDVNDNSPRLARKQWDLTVQETWGDRAPDNTTLLEIAAADRDTANYFYYRVRRTCWQQTQGEIGGNMKGGACWVQGGGRKNGYRGRHEKAAGGERES